MKCKHRSIEHACSRQFAREHVWSKRAQAAVRSWDDHGVSAMLPKGGSKVWSGPMISINRNQDQAAPMLVFP